MEKDIEGIKKVQQKTSKQQKTMGKRHMSNDEQPSTNCISASRTVREFFKKRPIDLHQKSRFFRNDKKNSRNHHF